MKNLTAKVFRVNGQYDVYASESTKRVQNYSDLAKEQGRDWNTMSKRSKANFRKRQSCKEIPTLIEVFEITATVPVIFSEFQLQESAIHQLIFSENPTIFLKCKNGTTGYSTADFKIKKINEINN